MVFPVSNEEGIVVVDVLGAVNSRNSPSLREIIHTAFHRNIKGMIVNIDAVNYLDSSALATLIEGVQLAEQYGSRFVLAGSYHENVRHILEITRLDSLFDKYPTTQEAISMMKSIGSA